MFNFRLWAKGLAAGVIGGAATAATTAISDRDTERTASTSQPG